MSIIRSAILLTASLLLAGCNVHTKPIEADAPARDAVASSASPCNGATDETLMGITEHANGLASICRLDGQGDCLYTEAFGKTFISSRPDFNGDGLADFLIKDFTGSYGDHDIVHHLGYAACTQGGYVNVLSAFVTSAKADETQRQVQQWALVEVTRDCYDESTQSFISHRYTLSWDASTETYGPPDGNADLSDYCTAREMSLPAAR